MAVSRRCLQRPFNAICLALVLVAALQVYLDIRRTELLMTQYRRDVDDEVRAARRVLGRKVVEVAREVAAGRLNPERITESTIARHLQRPDIPDVDLFLRTSGEQRSSNFMLWQAAYAEYIFQDKLWPDYDRRDLWAACEEYASRTRRFGSA